MVKIQQNSKGQYTITIPKEVIEVKKWKKGVKLYPYIDENGNLTLKEIK